MALGDVFSTIIHESKKMPRGKGDIGYIKHYGVFTEVTDTAKYKGSDTWKPLKAYFGDVTAQDMSNALIELARAGKTASIKVGSKVLVAFTEKDFQELTELVK
jgi:hypothetical protein